MSFQTFNTFVHLRNKNDLSPSVDSYATTTLMHKKLIESNPLFTHGSHIIESGMFKINGQRFVVLRTTNF